MEQLYDSFISPPKLHGLRGTIAISQWLYWSVAEKTHLKRQGHNGHNGHETCSAEDFKYFNESSRDDDGGIIGEVLESD